MSEGVMTVQKLEALVVEDQGITTTNGSASRLALLYSFSQSAIEITSLQVYTSTLVFSPTSGLNRLFVENEESNETAPKPNLEIC